MAVLDGTWVQVERVEDAGVEAWTQRKWCGPGRDPRIVANRVDAQGHKFLAEHEAVTLWKPPRVRSMVAPLMGVAVAYEYLVGIKTAGITLHQHDAEWKSRSGVPPNGVVARFHTALIEIVKMFICIDQLDPSFVLAIELAVRYLVFVEAAVGRNPKQPDWDGLELIVAGALSTAGSVEVPRFQEWLSGVQRDQAQIMKQGRLLRELKAAAAKAKGKKDEKDPPP